MKIFKIVLIICLLVINYNVIIAQPPNWNINSSDYQYTMTITAQAIIDCEASIDTNNMLGAFINDSLAGFAKFNIDVNGNKLAYATVYSNVAMGETVEIKLYKAETDELVSTLASTIFEENASIGNAATPLQVKTNYYITSLSLSNDTVYEYFLAGDTVGNMSMMLENGQNQAGIYNFVNDNLGPDNESFTISGNTLTLSEDVDYLAQDEYKIHIGGKANNSNCSITQYFTIRVINTNVPPTDIMGNPAYIDENEPVETLIIELVAEDNSPNDSHTFEFINNNTLDNSSFKIEGNKLLSNEIFDYESKNEYQLEILVTDNLDNTFVDTFTVKVNDIIEYDNLKSNNYISPNGDGINDYFEIENVILYKDFTIQIFNDNGNEVFKRSEDYSNNWNGLSQNGKELPSGTYFYYFSNNQDSSKNFKGKIYINRPNKF